MDKEAFLFMEKAGKTNPFRTPEDYFDKLTSRVMSELPQKRSKKRRMHYAIAAALTIPLMSLGTYFLMKSTVEVPSEATAIRTEVKDNTDRTIDDYTDVAMMDKDDMYTYLYEN